MYSSTEAGAADTAGAGWWWWWWWCEGGRRERVSPSFFFLSASLWTDFLFGGGGRAVQITKTPKPGNFFHAQQNPFSDLHCNVQTFFVPCHCTPFVACAWFPLLELALFFKCFSFPFPFLLRASLSKSRSSSFQNSPMSSCLNLLHPTYLFSLCCSVVGLHCKRFVVHSLCFFPLVLLRCTRVSSSISRSSTSCWRQRKCGPENLTTPNATHSKVLAPPGGVCTNIPSQPTPRCCSPSFMGESATLQRSQRSQRTVRRF